MRLLHGAGHSAAAASQACRVSALAAAREGMISNPTNPRVAAFMPAFLPQFVDPAHGPVAAQPLVLGAVQKLSGPCVLGTVAPVSGTLGGWLARGTGSIAWQERFTGAVLVALGPRLLLAGDARAARG